MTTAQEIYDLISPDIFKNGVLQRIDFGNGLRTLQKAIEVVETVKGLSGIEKKNLVLDVLDIALKNHVGTGKAVRIIADVAPTLIDQLVVAYNSELFQKLQKNGCFRRCY